MNWEKFLNNLLSEYRLSYYQLADLANLPPQTLYRVIKGETAKPTQNTIAKLEDGLGIRIDDSDPANIKYTRMGRKSSVNTWDNDFAKLTGTKAVSLAGSINKGIEEMQNDVAAYTVIASDETDLFEVGEEILLNKKKEINSNEIVIIKLKNGKVKIKRCTINETFVFLIDKSFNVEQINLNEIDCMFSFYGKIVTNIN